MLWRVRLPCSSTPCATTRSSLAPSRRRRGPGAPAGTDVERDRAIFGRRRGDARPSSAASAIRCWRPRRSSPALPTTPRQRPRCAAAASYEASANVRDIASAADELSASVNEIDRQVAQSNAIATKAVSEAERTNRGGQRTRRSGQAHRRRGQVDHRYRRADQSAGAQRHHRGRARRRGRAAALPWSPARSRRWPRQTSRATEEIGAQIAGMQRATQRSIEAIASIETIIREIGNISGAIAAAVTEQGAATRKSPAASKSPPNARWRPPMRSRFVGRATEDTALSAGAVKAVADDLGRSPAASARRSTQFFDRLSA